MNRSALFVYYTRDEWPIRASLRSQFRAFRRYFPGPVAQVNVAFPVDISALKSLNFDVIVYHTTALALRWYPSAYSPLTELADALASSPAYKIGLPQDEYIYTDALTELLNIARIDLVLSAVNSRAQALAYRGLRKEAEIRQSLTHTLSDEDTQIAERYSRPLEDRPVWVGYRAWNARPWVGRFGQLKVAVGDAAREACKRQGHKSDISVAPSATIFGDAWWRFLGQCRAVVGVEGGASLHDPSGEVFRKVESYLEQHPDASYAEVEQQVMYDVDQSVLFSALSPRHLEAAATRTAQILVEGEYSGVLQPERHYIPVRSDLSDMDEAVAKLGHTQAVHDMLERTYADIVASGRYGWPSLIEQIVAKAPSRASGFGPAEKRAVATLNQKDRLNFERLKAEVAWGRSHPILKTTTRLTLGFLKPWFRRP